MFTDLRAELEVAIENGSLHDADKQEHKHQEEKAEHEKELLAPNAIEDEEELDEDATKG